MAEDPSALALPLARIADALERLSPPPPDPKAFAAADAFVWRPGAGGLIPARSQAAPLDLLLGVEPQKQALLANTRAFAAGRPANNALLWGARGTGKSALIRAVHAEAAAKAPGLKIVAIAPQDAGALAPLMASAQEARARVLIYVDDLTFTGDDPALKALKPALDGGLAGADGSVIVYATSNRRQIVARDSQAEADGLFGQDLTEERLALADRFGLRLGFHTIDETLYLAIVQAYAAHFELPIEAQTLALRAKDWARRRGGRSGRAAWQFILAVMGDPATLS